MLTKDRAVCIRATDFSETSQVVTLFARLSGKVRAMARGSKRPKSAFDGPVEPLSVGDIIFAATHKDKLATLTEFRQQSVRGELRRNLFALHGALLAAELLDRLTEEYDPHVALFDHFEQFLQDIEDGQVGGARRDILVRLILLQLVLLHEVGFQPALSACANCKRAVGMDWRESYFSPSANGLICRDCETSFPDRIRLSTGALTCLTELKQMGNAEEKVLDEIERLLIRHFTEILGYRPKTADYVRKD